MNLKLICLFVVVALISSCEGATVNLQYTDSINTYNTTIMNTTYFNVPPGNIIDSIVLKPSFLAGVVGSYDQNITYYCGDHKYIDSYQVDMTAALLHLFSNKCTYNVRHTMDSELLYQKEYETYINKYCWFPIKISSYFGSHSKEDESTISIESEIVGHTGIKRASDVFIVYNAYAYSSSNYTIQHSGYSNLDVAITYKIEGLHTPDYYIGQLSPTLKNLYKLGFSWLDKELYILSMFIISDKLISMIMFWIVVIAQSFVPILFITLICIVPYVAYYNSNSQKTFISNLVRYYGLFFSGLLNYVKYIVMLIMRVLEIVRSLIPFI